MQQTVDGLDTYSKGYAALQDALTLRLDIGPLRQKLSRLKALEGSTRQAEKIYMSGLRRNVYHADGMPCPCSTFRLSKLSPNSLSISSTARPPMGDSGLKA